MKSKNIRILAIETSCDETAAAVICEINENSNIEYRNPKQIRNSNNQIPKILSNIISSQADLHAKTGGVVPEVASRAHMEAIIPVVEEALRLAKSSEKLKVKSQKFKETDLLEGITHIAVTAGPGLIGSLLVGFNAAKAIAAARNLPLIAINHIEGHIYSAFGAVSQKSKVKSQKFPILASTVSGGHTSLTLMKDHGKYETIGETIDDAAGEAFDKVAKLLGLGYPGGPVVSRYAAEYRGKNQKSKIKNQNDNSKSQNVITGEAKQSSNSTINLPRPLLNKPNFDFSFSGLKTAVLTEVNKRKAYSLKLTAYDLREICYAFEEAVVDVLVTKTLRAVKKYQPRSVVLAGGVAANRRLREELEYQLKKCHSELVSESQQQLLGSRNEFGMTNPPQFLMPPIELCGDNAAMIGLAAFYHILTGEKGLPAEALAQAGDWRKTKVDSNLEL
ncbi:MAG: tRNA N6-adenosine threonylcarbamoyltransferase [Candidatus Berkelbacteria bacterium Athens1014_28]|uniref:tRNA N6-adenosine threonylcarbamoyltransferase n=1 Tax=Candidatus Berkelbacteria bacterium Athens1014_28 TaxID=2017145 RepID=A0A554LNJ7_9BACT|nr:MAG: tRNA N6-adenosine threonylcarbamoyltransferase [Candidatus Berkelbacteria bacterium Athens1014_28]